MKRDVRGIVENTCILVACVLLFVLLIGLIPRGAERETYVSSGRDVSIPPLMVLPPDSMLNTGGLKELDALPGIGPVIAGNIIETREKHGLFVLPENLLSVSGIGEKRLADIMAYLDEPLATFTDLVPYRPSP